ncbi:MAG: putative metalloprotease CJM1_0395 family protein [Desulfurivibrio sp.]|nr:putative metalloprotease CJM1_0395 family protein [Desulfurivibrio sp.]
MELNAILSNIATWTAKSSGKAGFSPGEPGKDGLRPEAGAATRDSFEQGQWWKNRAVAKGSETAGGAKACSCGACASCGARAYAGMAAAGAGGTGSLEMAAGSADHNRAAGHREVSADSVLGRNGKATATDQPAAAGESAGAGDNRRPEQGTEYGAMARQAATSDAGSRHNAAASAGYSAGVDSGGQSAVAAEEKAAATQAQAVRELSREEQLEVARLQQTETRVRAHEMAHLAVAGPYVKGGASFSHTTGPDGRKYVTGGEVSIDTSKEPTPEATLRKMRIIRAAAMAPADPSPQDRKVAAQANTVMAQASQELEMARMEQQHQANRQEIDMLSRERSTTGHRRGTGHRPGHPYAARQAAATLAGFERPDPQLQVAA